MALALVIKRSSSVRIALSSRRACSAASDVRQCLIRWKAFAKRTSKVRSRCSSVKYSWCSSISLSKRNPLDAEGVGYHRSVEKEYAYHLGLRDNLPGGESKLG